MLIKRESDIVDHVKEWFRWWF